MHPRHLHPERHTIDRSAWLRAGVLGANDGIVSTASLILGVFAAQASHASVMVAAGAGIVAGAMSMAAGEYISVSSQKDAEDADIRRERAELKESPEHELEELAGIYVGRGIDPDTARKVALQLTEHDAVGAHVRDELGISETLRARPLQAAMAAALSFASGGAVPVAVAAFAPLAVLSGAVWACSLLSLASLGALAARLGGAPILVGVARVVTWGTVAMALTAVAGRLLGEHG